MDVAVNTGKNTVANISTTHVACMLDLETLGLSMNCVIVSIAAVKIDVRAPEFEILDSFHRYIQLEGQIDRVIEAQTVLFWMKQNKDAQQELLANPRHGLHIAGKDFHKWYSVDAPKPKTVWAKGSGFDINIMDELYKRCSQTSPWHYRDKRDYRTLAECLPTELPRPRVLEHIHTAKDDAEAQAEHLWMIHRKWNIE